MPGSWATSHASHSTGVRSRTDARPAGCSECFRRTPLGAIETGRTPRPKLSASQAPIGDRIPNCNAKRRCARRRGRVNVIRCRAREPYGGVVCLRALKDRLLSRLLRRLLVVGQRPHGRGQQCTVRDTQHAVLGRQCRVEQPDRSHLAVQNAAQCTRADPYPLSPGMYGRAKSNTRPANTLDKDCCAPMPRIMPVTAPPTRRFPTGNANSAIAVSATIR